MYGHDVSAFIKENLPVTLNNNFKLRRKSLKEGISSRIIEDTFLAVNFKLCNESNIDTNFSGSTCVSLIYTPQKIITANIGDSRAVIGRNNNGGI